MTPDPEAVAERQIRDAQAAGAFENLPDAGKPLDLGDLHDPDWWIKDKLKRDRLSVLPPILAARLDREKFLESLAKRPTAAAVRREVARLNEQFERARLAPSVGSFSLTVKPLDFAEVFRRWSEVRGQK
ncbi:MAG: DUF1992 domain-containing protein [Planctomycetota bacterium]